MATAGPGGQEPPVDGHEAQELPVGDDLIEEEPVAPKKRTAGELKLKHGVTMEILDLSNNSNGELMVKMLWNVPKRSIVNRRVEVKYSDISQNKAKDAVYNQLGGAVFVDGVKSQQTGFSPFLDQEIEAFEDRRVGGEEEADNKPSIEFKEVSVHKSGEIFYLICSESLVFLLNSDESYATELSAEAVEELDFSVVWLGPKLKVKYVADDKMAVSAILELINNVNTIQPAPEYHGFPLASIVSHLRAFLYEEILDEQKCFYTTIVGSGEQRGTGKSLLFDANQNLLYGRSIPADKHISDAMMYKKLAGKTPEGKVPVFVNEWDRSSKLFNNSVTGIWEGSQWASTNTYKPRTVLLCITNATPKNIMFDAGVRSKVAFVDTGPVRMEHECKLEITKKTVCSCNSNHKFLPSIIGLALKTLLEKVTDEDRRKYSPEMQDEGDEREAQVLKDFDSFLGELMDAAHTFDLPSPPLFDSAVPHTCLTSFNEGQDDIIESLEEREEATRRAASSFVDHLVDTDRLSVLSHKTFRGANGFKIDSCESFPPEAQKNLRTATDSHTTRLNGKCFKFRFLMAVRLTEAQLTVITDFLVSFRYLYSCTLKKQQQGIEQFSTDFLEMIRISSTNYDRETEDVQEALMVSVRDEVEPEDLSCGVEKCPSSKKVWVSQDKLDKHRLTKAHKRAVSGEEERAGKGSEVTGKKLKLSK